MARMIKITGAGKVITRMRRATVGITANLERNLMRAGLYVQRESMKIVPIDENVLRSSARTRSIGSVLRPDVVVSYRTDYAVYVHEDMKAKHKKGKTAKFLERVIREKKIEIFRIIATG